MDDDQIEYLMGYGSGSASRHSFAGGDIDRRSFSQVSDRARRAEDDAKKLFLTHLAEADTSSGPVTTEIIKFHLVPDMRKRFNKFVKEHGCTATSRKITRQEQDLINKTRQSLMQFTSVKVTPAAQKAYLDKNPHIKQTQPTASTSKAGALADATAAISKKRNISAAGIDSSSSSAPSAKKAKA